MSGMERGCRRPPPPLAPRTHRIQVRLNEFHAPHHFSSHSPPQIGRITTPTPIANTCQHPSPPPTFASSFVFSHLSSGDLRTTPCQCDGGDLIAVQAHAITPDRNMPRTTDTRSSSPHAILTSANFYSFHQIEQWYTLRTTAHRARECEKAHASREAVLLRSRPPVNAELDTAIAKWISESTVLSLSDQQSIQLTLYCSMLCKTYALLLVLEGT